MSDSVLKVEGIAKAFGGVQALKGVSLEIGKGEIHCLAGENGSGKSTLIKVISGVHPPDAGTIEIEGRRFSRLRRWRPSPSAFRSSTRTFRSSRTSA